MPLYALYDPTTNAVTGFYDTNTINYTNLPTNLIEMTQDQWAARLNIAGWSVINNTIVENQYVPPPKSVTISTQDFYGRLTDSEQLQLSEASLSNAVIHRWITLATVSPTITLSNSIVINGIETLVTMGILTTDRANTILTP